MAANDLLMNIAVTATVTKAIQEFIQLNSQLEGINLALEAVVGSGEAATAALDHVRVLAERTGQPVMELARQYTQFAAAAKGTALEGDAMTSVFDAVAGAMGTLGRSTQETQRAFVALSQMMAKGQVYAEEWRGQLNEALPMANAAVQKATGLTTQEFNKMMEAGNLLAVDVLPALAKGLNELGVSGADRVDTLGAAVARFKNAKDQAFTEIGEAGVAEEFKEAIDFATGAVDALTASSTTLIKSIDDTKAFVSGAIPTWRDYTQALIENAVKGYNYVTKQDAIAKAGEASSKALEDLSAKALQTARDYTLLSEAAEKNQTLIKKQGEAATQAAQANDRLAEISGVAARQLQSEVASANAAAQAAQANADANQRVSDTIAERVRVIQEHIAKLEELKGVEGAQVAQIETEISARQKNLEELQRTEAQQQAVTEKSIALAEAERFAAQQAELAAETYGDQSDDLETLRRALNSARLAVQDLERTQRQGVEAGEELAITQALIQGRIEALQDPANQSTQALSRIGSEISALTERERALLAVMADGTTAGSRLQSAREQEAQATNRARDALNDLIRKRQQERELVDLAGQSAIELARLSGDVATTLRAQAEAAQQAAEASREMARAEVEAKREVIAETRERITQLDEEIARLRERQSIDVGPGIQLEITARQAQIAAMRQLADEQQRAADEADRLAEQSDAQSAAAQSATTGYGDQVARLQQLQQALRVAREEIGRLESAQNAGVDSAEALIQVQAQIAATLRAIEDPANRSETQLRALGRTYDDLRAKEQSLQAQQQQSAQVSDQIRQAREREYVLSEQIRETLGRLAESRANESDAAQTAIDTARADAAARREAVTQTQERISALEAEVTAMQAQQQAGADAESQIHREIETRQAQLTGLRGLLTEQQTAIDRARLLADQSAIQAAQAQLAADSYGDQSRTLQQLRQDLAAAQTEVANLIQAQAGGTAAAEALTRVQAELAATMRALDDPANQSTQTLGRLGLRIAELTEQERALQDQQQSGEQAGEALNAARIREAEIAGKIRDSIADLVERREYEHEATERHTDAIEAEGDARTTQLSTLAEEKRRRAEIQKTLGNERQSRALTTQAVKLDAEALRQEAQTLEATAAAKRLELGALKALLEAKRQQALLDGEISTQEQADLDRTDAQIDAMERERQSVLALAAAKRQQGQDALDLNNANGQVVDSNDDVVDSFMDGAEAAAAFGRRMISEAVDSLRGYSDAAADAVDSIIGSLDTWYNKVDALEQLASNSALFDTSAAAEYGREIVALEQAADAAQSKISAINKQITMYPMDILRGAAEAVRAIKGIEIAAIGAQIEALRTARAIEEMGAAMDDLDDQFDDGEIGLRDYITGLESLRAQYSHLSEDELDALEDALRDAKEEQQDLIDTAVDGLNDWRSKLLEIQGQQRAVEEMNWQQDRLETELALAEARRNGNAEEIAALNEQLALIDQYYAIKVAEAEQSEAEARAEKAAAQAEKNQAAAETAKARRRQAEAEAETEDEDEAAKSTETVKTLTPAVLPVRVVDLRVSLQNAPAQTVRVLEGDDQTLIEFLRALERGKAVYQ